MKAYAIVRTDGRVAMIRTRGNNTSLAIFDSQLEAARVLVNFDTLGYEIIQVEVLRS